MSDRIQKVLASQGIASRRQIEQWIQQGRIAVNGVTATLGLKITESDVVCIDDKVIPLTSEKHTDISILLYHKPIGEVCTRYDPEGRDTVFTHLPKLAQGRWIAIGRLDYNTSGLLLFCNDGEVANRLAHPRYGFEREYHVRVYGEVTPAMIQRLLEGVELEDGPARFNKVTPLQKSGRNQWFTVVLTEGRNRIVRRLWASQEVQVNKLERVRFGDIALPNDLEVGEYRLLKQDEVQDILASLAS
jgi:23S rRNA pseudouridine2605 synthase